MCVHVSNLFPTGVSTYTSKSKWVAQYDCVCGTTLKCVTTDAIENHLKGKQHAEAMAPQAPEFQDCTCDYGCKTSCKTNTKWSAPVVSVAKKIGGPKRVALLDNVVEPVLQDHAFEKEEREPH